MECKTYGLNLLVFILVALLVLFALDWLEVLQSLFVTFRLAAVESNLLCLLLGAPLSHGHLCRLILSWLLFGSFFDGFLRVLDLTIDLRLLLSLWSSVLVDVLQSIDNCKIPNKYLPGAPDSHEPDGLHFRTGSSSGVDVHVVDARASPDALCGAQDSHEKDDQAGCS